MTKIPMFPYSIPHLLRNSPRCLFRRLTNVQRRRIASAPYSANESTQSTNGCPGLYLPYAPHTGSPTKSGRSPEGFRLEAKRMVDRLHEGEKRIRSPTCFHSNGTEELPG
jgi:hypothetical protein